VKNPLDYISDWWDRLVNDEEQLIEQDGLTVLAFTHRLSKRRTVAVVTATRSTGFNVVYHAYEVENVSQEGWAQLSRVISDHPTFGNLTVWMWHQGVEKPVETWTSEEMA
jgi:hypothetical protein